MATIGEWIIQQLGGITESQLPDIRARSFEAGYLEGFEDEPPTTSGIVRYGYRKLATKLRDHSVDIDKRISTAWSLWMSSPLAKRVLVMKRDHVIDRGTMPTTEDEGLLDILSDFWDSNKLARRASEFCMQLFGFGEQCFPAFVRESDGRVMLGYIDPEQIHQVVHHPDNALEPWIVVLKEDYTAIGRVGISSRGKQCYRIIRKDQEVVINTADSEIVKAPMHADMLVTAEQANLEPWEERFLEDYGGQYTGSCFFTKVNVVSNQSRGVSDLIQLADWIDQADATLFALGEREQMADYFSFDVTVTGSNKEEIAARAKQLRDNPPSKGSVNVHNEAEVWQLFAPDLHQTGSIESFRAFLGFILGGAGFPVHWYGFGDDANRATATAQGDPTEKSLAHDQAIFKDMMLDILNFVRDQAIIAGNLRQNDAQDIDLPLPEIQGRDVVSIAQTLAPIVGAVMAAVDSGLMTKRRGIQAWAVVMQMLGIDYDPTEEEAELEEEQADMMPAIPAPPNANGNGEVPPEFEDQQAEAVREAWDGYVSYWNEIMRENGKS